MELGAWQARPLDQQDLVATDAEMAVGDEPQLVRVEVHRLGNGVEHDEVVAEPVHLGEAEFHGR